MTRTALWLVVGLSVWVLIACGRSDTAVPASDCHSAIERVRMTQARLAAARQLLDELRRNPGPVTSRVTVAGSAPTDEARARVEVVRCYQDAQSQLAGFLTEALSVCPEAGETAEALVLYSEEALRHARFLLTSGGSRAQARAILRMAAGLYASTLRKPPVELVSLLREVSTGEEATPPVPTALPARSLRYHPANS